VFQNFQEISFEPDADEDRDGIANSSDGEFLKSLADRICSQQTKSDADDLLTIAQQFSCVWNPSKILERLKQNFCRPSLIWQTATTSTWSTINKEKVPFMQGGGQWHESFKDRDKYFSSGKSLLDLNQEINGYCGTYDLVVSYSIVQLIAQHLQSHYRILEKPNLKEDLFQSFESVRRSLT